MTRYLRLVSLAILIVPALAAAQTAQPATHCDWEFALFAGGSFIGDSRHRTPVAGEDDDTYRSVGLDYAGGSMFGFRIAENRWDHWGASLEYGYSNQPLRFADLTPDAPSLSLGHSIHRFVYDVLYYPLDRRQRLRPFAFAGAGVALYHLSDSSKSDPVLGGTQLRDRWKALFSWGGGAKYLVRDQLTAHFQFSDRISGIPDYGLPGSAQIAGGELTPGFRPDGSLHNWSLSIGFAWQWGNR
ncbi:MAG: hypothetical protein ABIG68_09220 [Acidobacteriota bacterium]